MVFHLLSERKIDSLLLKSLKTKLKKPIISVILPVYCAEDHVAEAIESVVNQTIGIEKIQLLLIDDGSTDSSPEICKHYAQLYPDSIFYYRKENGGVSSAMNLGLSLAKGKYIARLDSDDTWDPKAFAEVVSFFDKHYSEIDCLSVKINIFGDLHYNHPLNFKYTKNRIIDLKKEPYCIQTTTNNAIYKAKALKGLSYNEKIHYMEDVYFNTQFLRTRLKYGVISTTRYNFRKVVDKETLSNKIQFNRKWYFENPYEVLFPLINESKEIFGKTDRYTQSVIAYFLRWRIPPIGINETLNKDEIEKYTGIIHQLLQEIDDDVISSIKGTLFLHRNFLYRLKYQRDLFEIAELDQKGRYRLNGNVIFNACGSSLARIDKVEIVNSKAVVSGASSLLQAGDRCSLHAEDMAGNTIPMEVVANPEANIYGFNGEVILKAAAFRIVFPEAYISAFRMYTKLKDQPGKYYCTVSFGPKVRGTFSQESGVELENTGVKCITTFGN